MTLAEKITMLRKQKGWSQEELSNQMDVSRQSVSKWESGASAPELEKLIRMSQLFGVSTDYLLLDQPDTSQENTGFSRVRTLDRQEAEHCLSLRRRYARPISLAVSALIVSPVPLIFLSGLCEYRQGALSENMAGGLGVILLLLIAAAAVWVLIRSGMSQSVLTDLQKESFVLAPTVKTWVQAQKQDFQKTFRAYISTCTLLCILSVIPLMIAAAFQTGGFSYIFCTCILLVIISVAVNGFVWSGCIQGSFQMLLQEESYSPEERAAERRLEPVAACYWCIATALYLGLSFVTMRWDRTWIVWPCAGVLYAAVIAIAKQLMKKS